MIFIPFRLRVSILSALLLSLCVFARGEKAAPSTPLHFSRTEATTYRERGRLLLTVRVQVADLEAVLSERAEKPISVGNIGDLAPLALEYVREKLVIETAQGQELRLEWAGHDVTTSQLFLFFEAPLKDGLIGARVTDALLLEKLPDQINSFEVLDGAIKQTLVFSHDKTEQPVDPRL